MLAAAYNSQTGVDRVMADVFSKEQRSAIMSRIRSTGTEAERMVFRYLRKEGVYFQKHYKGVVGNPDIALPSKKRAVFIDGDFWHGRSFDRITDEKYWIEKISSNMERDKKVNAQLKKEGWDFIRVWESDIKRKSSSEPSMRAIKDFLTGE